ncbi:MAG: energy-coupling factor ABC transporter permease [Candidatus Bathyarchaeia archaeon]
MHIPDGFLDPWIITLTFALSVVFWIVALRRVRRSFGDRHVPVLAVMTAGIFAAQMINWPVGPGGTTAHLIGGPLIAAYLGPSGGIVALSIVLVIQAFFFSDGGLTALGANVLNMAIIDVIAGYYLFRFVSRLMGDTPRGKVVGAFIGGWLGITLAAAACGLEIGLSSQFPYGWVLSLPIMTLYHGFLGIIEGIITASVVGYTLSARPDLLGLPKAKLT